MSGRPKNRLYQYDSNGKFIKSYESESAARSRYYFNDKGKRPMFGTNGYQKDYHILPDNSFLVKERIGRIGIQVIKQRIGNKETLNLGKEKIVLMKNIDKICLARFFNEKMAYKLTKIPMATIYSSLRTKAKEIPKNGIYFEYE